MQLSTVYSRACVGLDAPLVRVETHLANGLPAFHIVGLPETAVRESKDRVRSALLNSHFDFPDRRITVNLAPADLPKEGGRFDLPIALGILAASQQLPVAGLTGSEFYAELALDGSLQEVRGIIPAVIATTAAGRSAVVPPAAAQAAARVPGSTVLAAADILTLCAHLNGAAPLDAATGKAGAPAGSSYPDLSQVRGQAGARRALEIAASGNHNLLLFGPPGTGKTLLASRLPGILPPLEETEALVAMALADLSGDALRRRLPAPVPGTPPQCQRCGPDRGRQQTPTGRNFPRPRRRAVSRRTARSFRVTLWRRCANRWNRGTSPCPEHCTRFATPPGSNWWPQ